jgi:hypothetical protein
MDAQEAKRLDPIEIECPQCKASPGKRCLDGIIGSYQYTHHNMRISAASRLSPQSSGEKETDPICRNCDEHKSNHGELPISGFLYCRKVSKRFEPISALDKLVREEMKDGLYDKVPVEPSQTESASHTLQVCENCGHGVSIHEWEDEATSCCMYGSKLFPSVGESQPCMCPGYKAPKPIESSPQSQQEKDQERQAIDILVDRFSEALRDKLYASEKKYNWRGGWKKGDWHSDLLRDLRKHIEKGDPRDVAAYCAFAWWHQWSLSSQPSQPQPAEIDGFGDWRKAYRDWIGSRDYTELVQSLEGQDDCDECCDAVEQSAFKAAWQASCQSLLEQKPEATVIDPLMSLLELHEKYGGLDCPKINEDCGICDSCKLKKLVQQYRAAAKGKGK